MWNKLRTWRKLKKISLIKMAKILNAGCPATISRWERVESTTRRRHVLDVFELTDGEVDANDLIGITSEMINDKEILRTKKRQEAERAKRIL